MKEKTIDEHRSLEIISQMIADTSATIDNQSGKYFLLWGYTTVIVSVFEYIAQVCHLPMPLCLWAWWLIPLVGGIGTILFTIKEKREAKRPKSYLDRSVSAVWRVFGASWGMLFVAAIVYGTNLLFLTVMMMAMGTVITGMICRHKVLIIAGKAGMVLSLLFPARHLLMTEYSDAIAASGIANNEAVLYIEILIFALIFAVMMIIPGHILRNRAKQNKDA